VIAATFDTNVLVSGLVGLRVPTSTPGQLLRAALERRFMLVLSHFILGELERTLRKPYFAQRHSAAETRSVVAAIARSAIVVRLSVRVRGVATHPDDDRVLATALSGGAGYLVTGDKRLLALHSFRGVELASPAAFLKLLASAENG
jgi:putative PIN family toxin of toxin-antitoxin system